MTSAARDAEPTSVTASPAAAASAVELRDAQVLRDALASAGSGGKRFRPRLVRSVHDLLGGDAGPAVDQVADAVEMLHTAFIVHDDVIDGDDLRRGGLSTPGRFHADALRVGAPAAAARSFATAGAILTGDLALGALLGAGARDGEPLAVGDDLDVVEAVAQADEVLGAHPGEFLVARDGRGRLARVRLRGRVGAVVGGTGAHWRDPIQREIPMRAARPTKNARAPSGTGPKPPSSTPPGFLEGLAPPTDLIQAMMSRFSSAVS